ncbi:MAG: MFS transporter [Betaproteobacteria bacterium]|nr:MFS transporter [Betaproteobacteria bacterium]
MRSNSWPEQSFNFGYFFFCYYSFVGVFPTYVPLFFAHRGISAIEVGVLMSLMQAMRIIGPNLWGWVADVTQKRSQVLQFTAIFALITFLSLFFGETFFQFALIMIAINLFTSAQGPLSDAIMLAEMRGNLTRYGQLRLWGSVGYIVMVSAVGFFLDRFGIDWMPWIGALILALVFAVSLRIHDTASIPLHKDKTSVLAVLRRREVMAFMISACFMLAAHSALYAFYSLYLAQLGYSSMTIGFMWAFGAIAEIIFFIYQAPIFNRFGLKTVMVVSLLLTIVRFILIGVGAESLVILLIAQWLHAATFGAHHSASIITMQRWFAGPLQARGQAAFISVSYGIGGTFGGLFLSLIWGKWGAQTVYLFAAGFALLALGAAMLSYRWQNL